MNEKKSPSDPINDTGSALAQTFTPGSLLGEGLKENQASQSDAHRVPLFLVHRGIKPPLPQRSHVLVGRRRFDGDGREGRSC